MKKFLISLLAISFLLTLFVPTTSAQPSELKVWVSPGQELNWMRSAAQIYEEKTGIKIIVQAVSELDQPERLALDGPSGHGPDVVGWPHDALGLTVRQGLISPLEEFIDENYIKDSFLEVSLNALSFDAKLYGLPYSYESVALLYNKDLMPNPPSTFNELIEEAKDLTVGDQYGFLYNQGSLYDNYAFIAAYGGYLFGRNPDGSLNPEDIGLAEPGVIEASEFIKSFRDKGLIPRGTDRDVVSGLFGEGKVGAIIDGPWSVSDYLDVGINIGVAPLPTLPNGEEPSPLVGVKGYYLSNFSNYKQASADFIKFITNSQMSMDHYRSNNVIIPHKDVMESEEFNNDEYVIGFAIQASRGTPMPNIPEIMTVWVPIGNGIEFILDERAPSSVVWPMVVEQIEESIYQMRR